MITALRRSIISMRFKVVPNASRRETPPHSSYSAADALPKARRSLAGNAARNPSGARCAYHSDQNSSTRMMLASKFPPPNAVILCLEFRESNITLRLSGSAAHLLTPRFDALQHLRTPGGSFYLEPQFRAGENTNAITASANHALKLHPIKFV